MTVYLTETKVETQSFFNLSKGEKVDVKAMALVDILRSGLFAIENAVSDSYFENKFCR
jgi:hypothetical protein